MHSISLGFGSRSFAAGLFIASVAAVSSVGLGCAPLDVDVTAEDVDAEEQAAGTVYRVGPTRTYKTLADVASRLSPGDVVEVDGNATYPGDVWLKKGGTATSKVTIRGVRVNGKRPVLRGGTNTIQLNANHIVMEGFDVTGGTSRCIFTHGHDLTIRDTVVHDCPAHGILGADSDSGSLTLEYVEVYRCGAGETKHPIYIATDESTYPGAVFRMQHSYIHDANGGNAVKSRAERNEIYHNWIEGGYWKELELIGPDGQDPSLAREDSDVVGNVFRKTRTQYVVRVGGDGTGETNGRYRFVNNTFLLAPGSKAAIHLHFGVESIELHNNVFHRAGGGSVEVLRDQAKWATGRAIVKGVNNAVPTGTAVPAGFAGTLTVNDPGFTSLANRDVSLISTSPLRNAGVSTIQGIAGREIRSPLALPQFHPPKAALAAPGTALRRTAVGAVDIGAFEFGSGVAAQAPTEPTAPAEPEEPAEPAAPGDGAACASVDAGEWVNTPLPLQWGTFAATWDVTPSASSLDATIGVSRGAADQMSELAASVVFDRQGNVRVLNGSSYEAMTAFRYTAGTTYTVRMVVEPGSKRYAVYIRPENGQEVQLAYRYAFRKEQVAAGIRAIDNWAMTQSGGAAPLAVCGFSID
ncbi:right-handed parallel beta-helix repeat-containing protein [Sorangium sp. So ce1097]|uniref:right-handed parallel beta-helix repeat-containing protein n=1 Tax=Sorangium sp. So ce1097 TaxID=3133330 RepID=UPI003F63114C